MLARARLQHHPLVLLLAGLHAGTRDPRRAGARPVRRLPRRSRRGGAGHDPDLHRRPHVGRELGSGLARGRDLYRDVWLVSAAGMVRRPRSRGGSARHPAVVGWLVSNEMPLYAGPATTEEIAAWARILVQAVRSSGATQPISLGDGAWGVEVSGARQRLLAARARRRSSTSSARTSIPMEDDQVRQLLTAAFVCELAGGFGKPVVLEEFGVSSRLRVGRARRRLLPQVLHTSLLAGAPGWIAWNNCDYDDLRDQDPYRHHAFEMHFGLTDRPGARSHSCTSLPRSPTLVVEIAASGWERGRGRGGAGRPRALRARDSPSPTRPIRRDMRRRTSSRRTSLRARPISRSSSCASATGSPPRRGCTSSRAPSCSPAPASSGCASCAERARPSTSRTSPGSSDEPARALARVARRDLRRAPPAALRRWSTRSSTTRWSSSFVDGLRRPRAQAPDSPSAVAGERERSRLPASRRRRR